MLFDLDDLPIAPVRDWPFGELEPFSYSMICADPPWRFSAYSAKGVTNKAAAHHYDTMSIADIKALPVWGLAAPDCILWLWATAPLLPEALDVMRAWRFQYVTMGTWAKRTRKGKLRWGTGYRLRSTSEPFLIGIRGNPKNSRSVPSHIDGLAREHSRKPDEAFAAAEKLLPDARRCELFSRERRLNWDVWGNQVDKFVRVEPKGKDHEAQQIP